jgi:hypothetical protein
MKEKRKQLIELKSKHEDPTEFAKEACDEGFCVSLAAGRRLFQNLPNKRLTDASNCASISETITEEDQ